MTNTNWINNPLQTKFQEVLFELHDLKPLASNSAKEVLQNQTDKMEELEKELFPKKPEVKPKVYIRMVSTETSDWEVDAEHLKPTKEQIADFKKYNPNDPIDGKEIQQFVFMQNCSDFTPHTRICDEGEIVNWEANNYQS
jgi:hypothetical protein